MVDCSEARAASVSVDVIGTNYSLLLLISLITRLSIPPIWLDRGLGQIRSCYRRSGMVMEQHETIRVKGIYYDISLYCVSFSSDMANSHSTKKLCLLWMVTTPQVN